MRFLKKIPKNKIYMLEYFILILVAIFTLYIFSVKISILFAFISIIPILVALIIIGHNYDKKFIKLIIFFLVSILLLSFSETFLMAAENQEQKLLNSKYGNYRFRIYPSSINDVVEDKISISDLLLEFDYSKGKGNITFSMSKESVNKLRNLRIYVPNELNITNVSLLYFNQLCRNPINRMGSHTPTEWSGMGYTNER